MKKTDFDWIEIVIFFIVLTQYVSNYVSKHKKSHFKKVANLLNFNLWEL